MNDPSTIQRAPVDMSLDPQTLADDMVDVCHTYEAFFASVETAAWDRPSPRGASEWTLRETVAHLCALDAAGLDSITHALRDERYVFQGLETRYQLNSYNRRGIDERLDLPLDDLRAEFLRVHTEVARVARAIHDDDGARTLLMSIYNRPVHVTEALGIIVMHAGMVHTAQVTDPTDLPPLWTQLTPDLRHRQIGRAMHALSLLYRSDIGRSLRATISFHVAGDGGGEWWVAVGPERAAAGEGVAACPRLVVSYASTDEFCRFMTVRLNVLTALLARHLKLRGDRRLFLHLKRLFSVDARP